MKSDKGRNRPGYLLGTIYGSDGQPTGKPKEVCVVEMGTGAEICRVAVDQGGRFLLRSEAVTGASSDLVELQVLCDRGSLMGRAETSVPRSTAAHLRVVLEKSAAVPSHSIIAPPRPGPALVAVGTLARIAKALKGRVPERDGRPLVPSWVNASIRELNTLAALGRRVLEGDRAAERAFLRQVGELDRDLGGASTGRPSGAGMSMSFSGRPVRPGPSGAGRGFGGPQSFGQPRPNGHGHPCIVNAAEALVATAGAFLLDRVRADRSGDLTQPGVLTRQTAELIKDRAFALEGFRDEVLDGRIGQMGAFSSRPPFGLGGIPGPDEPFDWPVGGPIPGGSSGGGGGIPIPEPGTPGLGGANGSLCDLWVDCVDQTVAWAESYVPPKLCPPEESIGIISPSAVCQGVSDVELEIRPVEGKDFSSTVAGECFVWLQRAYNKRVPLEIISASSDLVRVRLKEAKFSGCIGFQAGGVAQTPADMAFIDTCFRMEGLRNPVLDLARAGFNSFQIACTGHNGLDVVPPPSLVWLHASGCNAANGGTTQVLLAEEGCAEVTLSWHFDLGDESSWADPASYIRVDVIASDGTVVEENLPPVGSLGVTAREDEAYVIQAKSVVNGSICGQVEGTITVERYQQLHLTGASVQVGQSVQSSCPVMTGASVQVGQSANITVRSSCPALAGGLTISLTSSSPNRLQVPPSVEIPEGQDTVNVLVVATGTGCLDVVLTATAPEHLSALLTIEVFDTPTLNTIAPQTVKACQTFELQLTGTCFKAGETVVRALKADEAPRTLDILDISDNAIQCQGNNFPPGSWTVTVRSRGLESNAQVLDVQAIPVEVVSFDAVLAAVNPDFVPCQGNVVVVAWIVENASRIVIKENGKTFYDEDEFSGCEETSETRYRTISQQTTYRLEAYPVGGGPPTIHNVTVGVRGLQSLSLHNNSPHDLVVWKIEGWYAFSNDIPQDLNNKTDLPQGSEIMLTFNDCDKYEVIAINKPMAEDYGYDPKGDAIEIGHLRRYRSQLVGESDGDEDSHPIY